MFSFSSRSRLRLETCDSRIQVLFFDVIRHIDCSILSGFRTAEEQAALYASGRTKSGPILTQKDGVNRLSRHQGVGGSLPSMAVDAAPFPIHWTDKERFYHFAGLVRGRAISLAIPLIWGGDWDNDMDLRDQSFYDLVHFELDV